MHLNALPAQIYTRHLRQKVSAAIAIMQMDNMLLKPVAHALHVPLTVRFAMGPRALRAEMENKSTLPPCRA